MEFKENPELQKTYDKCKFTVKYWEHKFKKRYGRLPSKLDIKEASNEVRYAYKTYFQLKTAALENSFKDIDAFNFEEDSSFDHSLNESNSIIEEQTTSTLDEIPEQLNTNSEKTWGSHLSITNNKNDKKVEKETKVLNSFSRKLFNSSKLTKRNPRKSLSFSQKQNDSMDERMFLSQPILSTKSLVDNNQSAGCNEDILLFNNIINTKTKIVNPVQSVQVSNLSIVDSITSNKMLNNTLDSGWMRRITASVAPDLISDDAVNDSSLLKKDTSNEEVDYNSEDVIDNSEDEIEAERSTKRRKVSPSCMAAKPNVKLDFKNILSDISMNTNHVKKDEVPPNSKDEVKTDEVNNIRPSRQRKSLISLKELSDEDEPKDPFATDSDSSYELKEKSGPEKEINKTKRLSKRRSKNNKREEIKVDKSRRKSRERKIKNDKNEEPDDKGELYELEYSIKPPIKTVPRLKSISETLKTCILEKEVEKINSTKTKSKREQEKDKFEKKVASGNINENYVRINLKKKVFMRGKKGINFSTYKKQQWKSKKKALTGPDMDMGGCDGGMLTCFKCGEIGHFAKYCNAHKKGDALLPKEADDESYNYPTLEEAAEMLKDNTSLVIRKPQNDLLNKNEESAELNANEEVQFDSDDELLLTETLRLEQLISNIDMKQYTDSHVAVRPYYNVLEDGSIIETPREVFDVLNLFGHSSFRPGQEMAIMRILSGKSTLVTLSTGSGKSLCYQLPAYLYAKRESCISLIISPLVSLMEDQVTDIPHFLKASCLHTNQSKTQREKIKQSILTGNINVLLVSPEAVVAGEKASGFGSFLRKLPPIAFACIDEAHCLSQWSHNFRPSYLMICHILRERLGVHTILGLTATATQVTCDSIIEHLQIPDGKNGIISDKPLPDNLRLTVSKDANRDLALLKLLSSDKFKYLQSIIIYCTRREECERLAGFLRTSLRSEGDVIKQTTDKKRKRIDVQAEPYHAGMSSTRRKSVQKAFMSGQLRIVVATVAFGMGINKSDIRAVIHYNMPSSFESYVQEVGRAGRDGAPAHCHLFLDSRGNDENELKRHIYANTVDRSVIRKLLQRIFIKCSCKTNCPRHEVAFSIQETVQSLDITEEIIATLLCYLELHNNRYIEVLSPAYTKCKIISYSGPMQIRKAAKDCPILTMALAMYKKAADSNDNILEFPIIELASSIGCDSGICKHKLKNLEWLTINNQAKRSTLNVQFSNLGFRLLAPGNLTDAQLDEALDSLYQHVVSQEKTALKQLYGLSNAVLSAVESTYIKCINDISEKEIELKKRIREYFSDAGALDRISEPKVKAINEERIASDTRTLIAMYRDNTFTGKAVARIFFGIQSPNYPAVVWGRCKFWRAHLGEDFHAICKIATREILQMRQSK